VSLSEAQRENPLLEGLRVTRKPAPCALVIYGASGDLTHKKLFPALYALAFRRLLPERFAIVGVSRSEASDDDFRAQMREAVEQHARDEFREEIWDQLADGLHYIGTDFADEAGEDRLDELLGRLDQERGLDGNRLCYLAVPPAAFPTIVDALGKRRTETGWTRLIVEKPFGNNLQSARELTTIVAVDVVEDESFRSDDYLG
jgi:glucose-6-phosphate 1-dehydrogenase